MKKSNCPLALWDYCVEQRTQINNLKAKDSFKLNGTIPCTALTGEEEDMSSLCAFKWYEGCYFREQKMSSPFNKKILDHVLGPAKGEGNELVQWLMKGNGNVMPCQTLRLLNVEELNSETKIRSHKFFDSLIERRWCMTMNPPPETTPDYLDPYDEYEYDDEKARSLPEMEKTVDGNDTPIDQQPAYDIIVNAEVQLHH
eukprot:1921668-Ditylum_brightwellii.AAC.1